MLLVTGQIDSGYLGKAGGFLHEAEFQWLMRVLACRRVETVRRTEDIGRAIIFTAEDIRAGRPQPGAVEIPVDQQYRRGRSGHTWTSARTPPTSSTPAPWPRWPRRCRPRPGRCSGPAAVSSARAPGPRSWRWPNASAPWSPPTVEGRGSIPEDHPLCLGALTTSPQIEDVVSGADLVLAVGTRFQGSSTRNWRLTFGGTLAHLDADPAVIGRSYPTALPVVGDARIGLELLLGAVDRVSTAPDHAEKAASAAAAARKDARARLGEDLPPRQIEDGIRRLAVTRWPSSVIKARGRDRPRLPVGRPAAADPAATDIRTAGVRGDRPRPAACARCRGGQRAPGRADRRRWRVHAARR